MKTSFSAAQLADPATAEAESILRRCVHCGFCTATCPTFLELGDERDSPRGRIYMMKGMLERGEPANADIVRHIDRCLGCFACMTTCPSGVDYMHLSDMARARIADTYTRPLPERLLRGLLARLLPYPRRFRAALIGGTIARRLGLDRLVAGRRPELTAMMALMPDTVPPPADTDRPQIWPALGERRGRVALLAGCAQQVLAPGINAAAIRVLTRHGIEVVVARDAGCCGALVQHMGLVDRARDQARRNVSAWARLADDASAGGLDAIVVTTSGCGTPIKDYGHLLAGDAHYAERASRIAALTRDITEVLAGLELVPQRQMPADLPVAYHAACSLQHGQKIRDLPKDLLKRLGITPHEPMEPHICCGSAGTYNMLQPELAGRLGARKALNLRRTGATVVAAGNLGCLTQIANHMPEACFVHTVELADWLTGGPVPEALAGRVA
ncbi:glycolate oxidase subunit GlcF [Tistrella bauzanensis]|uniref:glycolate oxidase subunit GlcF n=1 Tax=Tistrella TaxID=171436 RepID=UPI0031F6FE36